MKVSELIKLAKKNGCYLVRNGGRHDIWKNPKTGAEVAIPRHQSKELKKGTEQNIKKGLGLK